jgi:hypothetical protein
MVPAVSRRTEPFDYDQRVFELKMDGFRASAFIEATKGELLLACRLTEVLDSAVR